MTVVVDASKKITKNINDSNNDNVVYNVTKALERKQSSSFYKLNSKYSQRYLRNYR